MKHSDLKVGMKVKRVSSFCSGYYTSTEGNISTVNKILDYSFITEEDDNKGCYWEAQYFEPVEEKEKETINDNIITMDKKYKTRCGYPVRVLCVDRNDRDCPVAALVDGLDGDDIIAYDKYGRTDYCMQYPEDYDLIEVSPWEDFKKDDKVMVSEEGAHWTRRYFAYAQNSSAFCYSHGADSWSACPDNDLTSWRYCRKPTQEELGEE